MTFQEAARRIVLGNKPINGTENQRHVFDEGAVITSWCEYSRLYIAWLDDQDGEPGQARGAGDTRLSAIADLVEALAGE